MAVDYDLGTARGRIEIDSSQLGRTSQAFRSFGLGMTAMGVAAAAGFAYVVKSAADFEHQMSAVEAVSNATESQMVSLKNSALDLASTTVFSANEIGAAMEALAKAGIPVEDMLGGATEATINLAAAAGDELPGGVERAAEVIANAMKTFHAGAGEMDHFADVLVGAAASSTISVEDMATSFRYAGPIAAELGLTIDDLSTVLAILGDNGIKGSTAGTSLRGVLLSLTPTSAKARDTMRDLGLITEDGTNRFYDMHGALKPMAEVMDILGEATAGLSEQERVAAFNSIFQRRAMNAALIMANAGAEGFNEYADAIAQIDASNVAATKLDNLTGDMTILRNSVDALIIRAGQPLQDMLRGWVQGLTDLVNKIGELDPKILTMIVQGLGIAAAFFLVIGATSLLISAVIRMYRNFVLLVEGIKLVASAMKLLTISFLTNPIVLFVAALVALGALLYLAYQRSEQFREAIDSAFDKIQPTIEAVVGWVQNFVSYLDELWAAFQNGGIEGDAFSMVLTAMGVNAEAVVGALVWLRDTLITVRDAAVTAFDWFADNVLPVLVAVGVAIIAGIGAGISWLIGTGIPALVRFGQAVGDLAMSFVSWFNDHVTPVLGAFVALVAAVFRTAQNFIDLFWPGIVFLGDVFVAVFGAIMTVLGGFAEAFMGIWDFLWQAVTMVLTIAWNLIKGIVEGALEVIQGIIQVFTGILTLNWSQVWTSLGNIVGGVWTLIQTIVAAGTAIILGAITLFLSLITTLWNAGWAIIGSVLSAAWTLIGDIINAGIQFIQAAIGVFVNLLIAIWNGAWAAVSSFLSAAWDGIVNAVEAGINAVVEWLSGLPGRAIEALAGIIETLVARGGELISGFLRGAQELFGDVLEWASGIPGDVLDAIGDVAGALFDAGVSIVQGFIDGIQSMAGEIAGEIDAAFGGVPSMVGGFLGIGSPSRITRQFGEWFVDGLVEGLQQTAGLQRQLASLDRMVNTGIAGGGPSTNIGSQDIINIDIDVTVNGGDAGDVRAALTDDDLLDTIIAAARAGRRG